MSILTKNEILKRINAGEIKIDPFDKIAVGPASVDFHLADVFRVFKKDKVNSEGREGGLGQNGLYHVDENANHKDITQLAETTDNYFVINPGQTIHGITIEKLTLPDNLCASIQGRSTIGRLGLTVHITASFIQPGASNKQVLEISNLAPIPLALHPGIAICQIIFMETVGRAQYRGKFQGQEMP